MDDLKYGLRIHAKAVGFTLIALVTLALGIGASTAVFSVVNTVMLKPLPYTHSEQIVIPWRLAPAGLNLGYDEIPWGLTEFHRISKELHAFQSLGAFKSDSFSLTGVGDPVLLEGLRASAGFFPALGVEPILGRTFSVLEDQPGHQHEVVLGYELWRDRFERDGNVLGRTVDLNGESYTVIGVMPAGFVFPRAEEMPGSFDFPRQAQLWVPLALAAVAQPNEPDDLAVIGRLKAGMTIAQSQAEMDVFSRRMENEFPQAKGWFRSRVTLLARQVAGNTRDPLLLILGAVGIVLLISCSNVANLLLARSVRRKTEFALRAALGAGQRRLVRQLLTESVLLAIAGGAMGIAFANAGVSFLKRFGPTNIPRLYEVGLDLRVLLFTLGVTLASGILFGLAPAIGAARETLAQSLKESERGTAGKGRGGKTRNALVVFEVALSLVLVVASGLLIQTFLRLLSMDPGFHAERVLTFELSLPRSKYTDTERMVGLYRDALARLKSIPGVRAAGIVEAVPMEEAADSSSIRLPDHPSESGKEPFTNYSIASPGYFSAMGTPIVRGRDFLETDVAHSVPVTVINSAMAKKFWPNESPIGKQVGLASLDFPLMTIVGVVADVKHLSLREDPGPEMYVPYTQKAFASMLKMHVVLRAIGDPNSELGSVREAVRSVDPDLPIANVTTLATLVSNSMAGQRFSTMLILTFGGLSLLLASIGIYGVVSYSATERTREIGIRMALGADARNVFGMIIGEGACVAGLGIAIGLLVAFGVSRVMASVLYGIEAANAPTYLGVALLLMLVVLVACYVPARRATRIDPMIALREE